MQFLDASAYQPLAATVFAEVESVLRRALPAARIDHVGSSAIPGAVSKGDLDVCVSVPAEEFAVALAVLQSLGYGIKTDTLGTPQLCMLESPRTDIPLAIQLIERGSTFEFFRRFRDALIADAGLVVEYNRLKRDCEGQPPAMYRERKRAFIEAVLARG